MKQKATLQEILAEGGCRDRDLSGFDFELIDDDQELAFEDCLLRNTRIKGDVLVASTWTGCDIHACDFASAELREAVFQNCNFFSAEDKRGVEFRLGDMALARFTNCNLSLALFTGCDAYDVAFAGCKLLGAQFDSTDFSRKLGRKNYNAVSFKDCSLQDALLADLNLSSCEIRDCDLTGADLRKSRLVNASLTNSELGFATLTGADFSGADLTGSNLQGFDLTDVKAYASMNISADQQHHLLNSIGIEVSP